MKCLLLAGVVSIAIATPSFAQGGYWVVGYRSTSKCGIVSHQPTVYSLPAFASGGARYDVYFADGPYMSVDDAKLARSTISACPKDLEPLTSGGSPS